MGLKTKILATDISQKRRIITVTVSNETNLVVGLEQILDNLSSLNGPNF